MILKKRNKMQTLADKLIEIEKIIRSTASDDPVVMNILMEGFGLSLNLIAANVENAGKDTMDISEHLDIITKVLGISVKDIVGHILNSGNTESDKEADQATLEFITSDLDDYEKFLAQNKAKEDLDFLNKVI
jgi:hypothetical protein